MKDDDDGLILFDLGEVGERTADMTTACKAMLDIAGILADKYGAEHGLWLLMTTAAIGARALNVTPRQAATATKVIRKHVDVATDRLGADSADVESIMTELHLQ